MTRIDAPLCCGMLVLILSLAAFPAFAGNAEKLNGAWTPDVEATVELARTEPGYTKEKEAKFREQAGRVRIVFDLPGKLFIVDPGTGTPRPMPIDSVVENGDGTVLVQGKGLNDTWGFRPDGTLLLKHGRMVLKRVR